VTGERGVPGGRLLSTCWLIAAALITAACDDRSPTAATPTEPVDVSAPVGFPGSTKPLRIVAVGDIACPPGGEVTDDACQQAATAKLAASIHPDAVIALGDLQYHDGTAREYMGAYDKSWGSLRPITRPVPGNHDYHTDDADGFFAYFGQDQPWYAWDAGSWRIYMLNSNCDEVDCAAEEEWLESDLAANPRSCSAIAMHHPRYSSGRHHSADAMSGFWQIAWDHHVDLALAGHDHDYERFLPMDADGNVSSRGITSFVSGTGGGSLYELHDVEPGSVYFQSTEFGVLTLRLARDEFRWRYTTIGGTVLDHGRAPCV